jgi:muramoyltetrapeptide carboxypeptidase
MVHGVARGVVVGGTASLIDARLGAPGSAPPENAILLLEDITEDPYRLDRIFTSLLRANWFTGVNGIALGSWVKCGQPAELEAMMSDLIGSLGIPAIWELGFGHCPGQLTVPIGTMAELDADNGTLTILEPALR